MTSPIYLTLALAVPLLACAEGRSPSKPAPSMPRQPDVVGVTKTASTASKADNGQGETVATTTAINIDIAATQWIGRAADPVLKIGAHEFRTYEFPVPNVIRFTIANPTEVPQDQPVVVQFQGDDASRVIVAPNLGAIQ